MANDKAMAAARRGGAVRIASICQRLVEEIDARSGIIATVQADAVVLEGRNLTERWMSDASLRDVGRRATS